MTILTDGNTKQNGFDDARQLRLRHFLIEFGTRYVSVKKKSSVAPSTMLGYVRGVQRRLKELNYDVNLFSGPIFNYPNEGLKPVLDNKFSLQQSNGATTKSHNILTIDNVKEIFDSEFCNPSNATGFRNRLIFAVGLAIGARPTELCLLWMDQFTHEDRDGQKSWVYTPKVESSKGESKNAKGGVKAVRYRKRAVPIHDASFFGGTLNIYTLMCEYFSARAAAGITNPRFFLGVKPGKKVTVSDFYRNQPLGRNTCSYVVKEVCAKLGIRGNGEADGMVAHGLRATMISLLIYAGYSDASVVSLTGHRNTTSLQSYYNLRGEQGAQQLEAIFREPKRNACDTVRGVEKTLAAGREAESSGCDAKRKEDRESEGTPVKRARQAVVDFGGLQISNCTVNINIQRE